MWENPVKTKVLITKINKLYGLRVQANAIQSHAGHSLKLWGIEVWSNS